MKIKFQVKTMPMDLGHSSSWNSIFHFILEITVVKVDCFGMEIISTGIKLIDLSANIKLTKVNIEYRRGNNLLRSKNRSFHWTLHTCADPKHKSNKSSDFPIIIRLNRADAPCNVIQPQIHNIWTIIIIYRLVPHFQDYRGT